MCPAHNWETPVFLNVTAPSDLQYQTSQQRLDEHDTGAALLRRKLESQKGEVRSLSSL